MKSEYAARIILLMASLIIGSVIAGLFLYSRLNTAMPMTATVVATALIAFFGFIALRQGDKDRWEITESSMRTAIAAALVLVYIVLLSIVSFFGGSIQQPPVTTAMVTSFTTTIGERSNATLTLTARPLQQPGYRLKSDLFRQLSKLRRNRTRGAQRQIQRPQVCCSAAELKTPMRLKPYRNKRSTPKSRRGGLSTPGMSNHQETAPKAAKTPNLARG
jgi:hypothetical protein